MLPARYDDDDDEVVIFLVQLCLSQEGQNVIYFDVLEQIG